MTPNHICDSKRFIFLYDTIRLNLTLSTIQWEAGPCGDTQELLIRDSV